MGQARAPAQFYARKLRQSPSAEGFASLFTRTFPMQVIRWCFAIQRLLSVNKRDQLRRVLPESSVVHLHIAKRLFDRPKLMLYLGPDLALVRSSWSIKVCTGVSLSKALRSPGRIAIRQQTVYMTPSLLR